MSSFEYGAHIYTLDFDEMSVIIRNRDNIHFYGAYYGCYSLHYDVRRKKWSYVIPNSGHERVCFISNISNKIETYYADWLVERYLL